MDPQPRASAGSTHSAHTSCCWLQLFPTELLIPSTRRCCVYLPSDPRGAHTVPHGNVPSLRMPRRHCSPRVHATPYTPPLPGGCRDREGFPGSSPRIYNDDFEARHICSLAKGWVSHQAPLTPCSIIPSGRAICTVWTQTSAATRAALHHHTASSSLPPLVQHKHVWKAKRLPLCPALSQLPDPRMEQSSDCSSAGILTAWTGLAWPHGALVALEGLRCCDEG